MGSTARIGLVSAALLGACAPPLDVPPAVGEPCASDADCETVGLPCGQGRACLSGRCETAESDGLLGMVQPCPDSGRPALSDTDAGS